MPRSETDATATHSASKLQPAHRWFEQQAARTPDDPALVFEGQHHTYRALEIRANRLAHRLLRIGVPKNACVGVRLRRGVDHLVALLAVHKAGLTLVPVSSVSTIEPPQRMAYILDNARIEFLLTERDLDPVGPKLEHVFVDEADPGQLDSPPALSISPDDLAYVIYTSGSTGRPKGCAMPHRGLTNLVDWQLGYARGSSAMRTLQFNALGFDLCFQEIFPTWAVGGVLVVIPEAARRDPNVLLELVSRERVSRMILPFVALRQLAEAAELAGLALPELREVYVGGEALQLTPAIRNLFRRSPEAALINVYGPTEAHIVTAYRVPGAPDTWPPVAPIGRPIRGARIYIVNRAGQPVPPGVPGEVMIGGDVLVHGYLHNARATADRFVPDRFAKQPGAVMYRTGDLVRELPSGPMEFVGRSDHQVKIRGFRVEPGEVETALASHPAVQQVVVQGRNDTGETRLVAYLVARGAPPSTGDLRSFLAAKLPDEMIPSAFVVMPELPLTADGKVNLKALPAPGQPRPNDDDQDQYVAPRDELETVLAKIWQEVLKVDRVGAHDNFFELGGHSFLAFRVTTRLREVLPVQIATMELFKSPTVAKLAAVIRQAQTQSAAAAKPPLERSASVSAVTEVSITQPFFYRMNREAPNIPAENQDASLCIRGLLDVAALERALSEITRRHDVLRASFRRDGDKVMQCVAPWQPLRLAIRDVPGNTEQERWGAASEIQGRAWSASFDLDKGPTARFELLRVSPHAHLLVAICHHIVFDGHSYSVFYKELGELYRAFQRDEPSPLQDLPFQYADVAAWQRKVLDSSSGAAQLAYWRTRFEGAALMKLVGDKPRGPVEEKWLRTGAGAMFPAVAMQMQLPADVVAAVRRQAAELQVTTFAVLAAAKFLLIRKYSGQDDVIMMSSVLGRDMPGTELLLGQFNNPLPLRMSVTGSKRIRELILALQEDAIAQRSNADLPATNLLGEMSKVIRIIFNFSTMRDSSRSGLPELPEAEVSSPPPPKGHEDVTMHDLAFFMVETDTAITAEVVCNADLFTPDGLRRMVNDYIDLTTWITGSSDRTI